MSYNIELSFDIIKNTNVIFIQDIIKKIAFECFCEQVYDDYEFDDKTYIRRNHCVISLKFPQNNVEEMSYFLCQMKKYDYINIELVYDEKKNTVLYASQYFVTQKMDKYIANNFKKEKRQRSYSDDENMILKSISNSKI
jgi:hypothetical protein